MTLLRKRQPLTALLLHVLPLLPLLACAPALPEDVRGTAPEAPTDDWAMDTAPLDLPEGCALGPADAGAWAGAVPVDLLTTEPYTFDAGVAEVIDAAPGVGGRSSVSLRVEGAVVINVGFPEDENIWVADAGGAMRTYRTALGQSPAPGDLVSFTVDELTNYRGELEITALGGFEIVGSGAPVWFHDATAAPIDADLHARQNVRAWAEVTGGPSDCAGNCYEVDLGGQTEVLRVSSSRSYELGACLDLFMPVGLYDGAIQLNVENFDWAREF